MSTLTAEAFFTFRDWLILLRNMELPPLTEYVGQVLGYSMSLEAKYKMEKCNSLREYLKETRYTFSTNIRLMVHRLARMGLGCSELFSLHYLVVERGIGIWLDYLYNRKLETFYILGNRNLRYIKLIHIEIQAVIL